VSNPSQITTVLATGCSGFLGRHYAHALVRHGFPVHAVSRTRSGVAADGITWHSLDLLDRDAATLPPAAPRLGYGAGPLPLCAREPGLAGSQSRFGQEFRKQGGQRFVGAGSSAEYAPLGRSMRGGCHADPSCIPLRTMQSRVLDGD